MVVLFLLLGGGVAFYLISKTPPKNESSNKTGRQLASAKPQFASDDSVAGYVEYEASEFQEVKSLGVPTVKATSKDVNVIIVAANVVSYGESGLYLYDLKSNKNFKLTSGGGDPRIMSNHFVLYGFDEDTDGKKFLGAKLLDLNTGKDKVIFSAEPEQVSGTICCSVSPDGFKVAFAQKGKISIWDIRNDSFKDYTVTLNPIAEGFSREGASYNVEMSYAAPAWVDNDSLIYADMPATKPVVVDGGTTKSPVNTNLYLLNLVSGAISELITGNSGIYDIFIRGGGNFVNELTVDTDLNQLSKFNLSNEKEPEVIASTFDRFYILSPKGDKLYIFPTLYKSDEYKLIDTNTKVSKAFNPLPTDIGNVSGIVPKGFAGEDRIILEIVDTAGTTNHEYIAIYNTTSNSVEQYTKIE